MLDHAMKAIGAVGNLLDLPGSAVRDTLAWRNPFDQFATPFSSENRTSGRELLRTYGLAGQHDTWGNFAGGMAAEMATDPLNLISGKAVLNAFRGRQAAQSANVGIRAANAKSLAQRAQGFMPEETIKHLHPSVMESGAPWRQYHGTTQAFDNFAIARDAGANRLGRGVYTTDDPAAAFQYAHLKDGAEQLSGPVNTRMHFVDIRNPFYTGNSYPVKSLGEDIVASTVNSANRTKSHIRRMINELRSSDVPDFIKATNRRDIKRMFPHRHPVTKMSGGDFLEHLKNKQQDINSTLRGLGFDGILDRVAGTSYPHNVTVALDPSQVYKPYVAAALKREVPVPKTPKGLIAGTVAHNILSRSRSR